MVMKFFRKRKNMKIILWLVAILIIPGFLIWGVGLGGGARSSHYAAVVNREPVLLRDYYKSLNEMEKRYKEIFGENAADFIKNINMEKIVLDNMIRETILLQQARRRRVRVLNSEIIEVIKSDAVFKNEKGEFDQEKYKEIISAYPSEELRKIEDEIRRRIMVDKLRELVISETDISIGEEEVDEYIKNHQITDADRESIRRTLMRQKGEEAFNDWYEKIKKNSDIQVNLSLDKPAGAVPEAPAESE
jgi:parvulin-like peptidyl-prolyl isomerase